VTVLEDSNEFDPQAVAVVTNGDHVQIGYVPRYLAREVRQLYHQCDPSSVELQVQRVNPTAPLQQRLLCRIKACWPEDFSPCSGDEFEPIASGVLAAVC
jgi:hypothetical protein